MKINTYQIITKRPTIDSPEYWELCDKIGTEHLKYGCVDVIEKKIGTVTKAELKQKRYVIADFKFYDLSSDCWRTGMMDVVTRCFYEFSGKLR